MIKKMQKYLSRRVEPEKITFRRIFAVQIVLFFAVYGIMLAPRFSTDGYSFFFSTSSGLDSILGMGRTGPYILLRTLLALGINNVTLSPIFNAVFILTVAWSAAVLISLLKPYCLSPSLNWLTVLLLELAVVLAYANIYFAELFFFADGALTWTFAVLFLTLALVLFCHRKRVFGTVLAIVCLYVSLSFYQAFLGFFMIFGSMMILIRHNVPGIQWTKQTAKPLVLDLLRLAAVGGGSSIASLLVMGLLAAQGYTSGRGPSLSVTSIFDSVRQMASQFKYYYPMGYPNYLTGFSKIVLVLSGPVLLCLLAGSFAVKHRRRKRYPFLSAAITLAVLFCGLLSAFAPHFISRSVWMTPRSICSFFAVFTVMVVVTCCNYIHNGKTMPWAEAVAVLLLLVVNVVGIQGIALDQIAVNRQDRAEAEEIIRYIQEYEAESGQRVDTISWRPDSRYTWTHAGIKNMFMDMNVRAGARSWSLVPCIDYYAGYRFKSETMPDEIWAVNFQGQEWDSFRPEEQIRFEGNKMYLMVY